MASKLVRNNILTITLNLIVASVSFLGRVTRTLRGMLGVGRLGHRLCYRPPLYTLECLNQRTARIEILAVSLDYPLALSMPT